MEQDSSRYLGLVTNLARQCLDRAADAPVLSQAAGWPVSIGAAAARVLLDESPDAAELRAGVAALTEASAAPPPVRFNDTFGFSRPVYHPLLVHLYQRAAACHPDVAPAQVQAAVGPLTLAHSPPAGGAPQSTQHVDISRALWWTLCRYQRGDAGDIDAARKTVDRIVDHPGSDGSLHPRLEHDQLDAWTYRELTGLHALARLALLDGNARWRHRVREVALHHQAVTQPDYTTYQPWAVFAFLEASGAAMFGEQQLHDTETNLHVETPGAGMLAGLLLADAADALRRDPRD